MNPCKIAYRVQADQYPTEFSDYRTFYSAKTFAEGLTSKTHRAHVVIDSNDSVVFTAEPEKESPVWSLVGLYVVGAVITAFLMEATGLRKRAAEADLPLVMFWPLTIGFVAPIMLALKVGRMARAGVKEIRAARDGRRA